MLQVRIWQSLLDLRSLFLELKKFPIQFAVVTPRFLMLRIEKHFSKNLLDMVL